MDHKLSFAYEKFSAAISKMATSPAPLPERVLFASRIVRAVDATHFRDSQLRRAYDDLMAALAQVDATQRHGTGKAAGMDDAAAQRLAIMITHLFFGINRAYRS